MTGEGEAPPAFLAPLLFTGLAVAVGVALLVTQLARHEPLVLEGVKLTKRFAPSEPGDRKNAGDRRREEQQGNRLARIRFRLTEAEGSAEIRVIDEDEAPVRTLVSDEPLEPDRRLIFHWDGRTDEGDPASPGDYQVEVLLRELDREIIPGERITLVAPDRVAGHRGGDREGTRGG